MKNIFSKNKFPSLLSCKDLDYMIKDIEISENLRILDCTFPPSRSIPNFQKFRIDNARYLDLSSLKDSQSDLTMEFPKPNQFKEYIDKLGLSKNNIIVCYDQNGIYSSPRAWFIFKAYHFPQVSILDGGLPKWMESGFDLNTTYITDDDFEDFEYFQKTKGEEQEGNKNEEFEYDKSLLASYEEVVAPNYNVTLVDTRPSMHHQYYKFPNSVNVPVEAFLREDYTLKSKEELEKLFDKMKIKNDPNSEIISSCGIGLSACLGVFAAKELLEFKNVKLYNGSYEEYIKKQMRK